MHILCMVDADARTPLGDDLRAGVVAVLAADGNDVEVVEARAGDIAPCRGCLVCFKDGAGACVTADLMAEINRRIAGFDVLCYLGPIVFGQFSATMKNVMDKGQINRMMRSRHLIAFGYGDDVRDEELATFVDIVRRHRGDANTVHPLFRERFEVFASRSLDDNVRVCGRLRDVL